MARGAKNLYTYKEKKHSAKGMIAVILGVFSLVIFAVLTVLCMIMQDTAGGMWIGAVAFSAFAAAFCGMLLGLDSFRERCLSYTLSKIGTLWCGFMVAAWFLIYCVGLSK